MSNNSSKTVKKHTSDKAPVHNRKLPDCGHPVKYAARSSLGFTLCYSCAYELIKEELQESGTSKNLYIDKNTKSVITWDGRIISSKVHFLEPYKSGFGDTRQNIRFEFLKKIYVAISYENKNKLTNVFVTKQENLIPK